MPIPNVIRYSTATQSGALRKGNFYLGVTDRDYGPSNISGYYNGVSFSSGYITYIWDGSEIRYNQSNTDSELNSFLSSRAGLNFSGLTSSLLWSITQSNLFVVNATYENSITENLAINLDASIISSYPLSGTTWYDMSLSPRNATLVNGPQYVATFSGAILFDGVDDSLTFNQLTFTNSNFTAEVFGVLPGPLNLSNRRTLFGGNRGYEFSEPTTVLLRFNLSGFGDTFININSGVSITANQVFHHVLVKRSGNVYQSYQNGSLRATVTPPFFESVFGQTISSTQSLVHSYSAFGNNVGVRLYNGHLFCARIYDRDLTSSEILSNYQSMLNRFTPDRLITNGLVLYLDAGYVNSFTTASNTWTDVSGYTNNAILTNGPTFSSGRGGSIFFDATNDFARIFSNSNPSLGSIINFLGRAPYTIEVWAMIFATQSGFPMMTSTEMDYGSGRDGINSTLWMPNASSVNLIHERFTQNTQRSVSYTMPLPLVLNNPFHMVSTFDGTIMSVYGNGQRTATSSSTGNITNTTTDFYIGARGDNSGNRFNGNIFIVRAYNRALSQQEVIQNYQSNFDRMYGSNIVTDGLIFLLDASYQGSFTTSSNTWYDLSGYGVNGTLTNGTTYSTSSGGAISFDGVDDHIDLGTVPAFDFTNGITIEIVVSFTTLGGGGWERFLELNNFVSGVGSSITFSRNSTTSNITFQCRNISGGDSQRRVISSGNPITTNQIAFFTVTLPGGTPGTPTPGCKMYKNGSEITATEQVSGEFPRLPTTVTRSTCYIGRSPFVGNAFLNGLVYSVKMYNRTLTAAEVLRNFNAQKAKYGL